MSKVNWKAVEQWRDALYSEKYKQGKGQLRDENDNYCCLGVFSEAAAKLDAVQSNVSGDYFYDLEPTWFPLAAQRTLGVKKYNPTIFGVRFSKLNDTGLEDENLEPFTFEEIGMLLDIALLEREGIE